MSSQTTALTAEDVDERIDEFDRLMTGVVDRLQARVAELQQEVAELRQTVYQMEGWGIRDADAHVDFDRRLMALEEAS